MIVLVILLQIIIHPVIMRSQTAQSISILSNRLMVREEKNILHLIQIQLAILKGEKMLMELVNLT